MKTWKIGHARTPKKAMFSGLDRPLEVQKEVKHETFLKDGKVVLDM